MEEEFTLRTRQSYEYQCNTLEGPSADHNATTYGIVRNSTLHKSKYFHVMEGLVPDIMLEGCLPFEVKEMLKNFLGLKLFTLEDLNDTILSFSYGVTEATNKPSTISSSTITASDHSLKQTGKLLSPI